MHGKIGHTWDSPVVLPAKVVDGHVGHGDNQDVGKVNEKHDLLERVEERLVDVPRVHLPPGGDILKHPVVEIEEKRLLSAETGGVGVDRV